LRLSRVIVTLTVFVNGSMFSSQHCSSSRSALRLASAGSVPTQSIVADLSLENAFYTAINFGASSTAPGTTEIGTANALTAGNTLTATHSVSTPQSVTWQAAFNDGSDEIATAWVSGQVEGSSCVFLAQGTTTLG
jgi:hypothetical protein